MPSPRPPILAFDGPFRFLSNFHPCMVEFEGMRFPSTEHAYAAAKSLDWHDRLTVSQAPTPGQAKRMGRRFKLRDDWEDVKLSVMEKLLRTKFNPKGTDEQCKLAKMLRATGSRQLVEGNDWGDTFWGVSRRADQAHLGVGENHLGRLLMNVRWSLIEERETRRWTRKEWAKFCNDNPERVAAPVVTAFTLNQKMNDETFRKYVYGLVFVSLPGALHGPDEEDATPEQIARAARVDEAARGGQGPFDDDVLRAAFAEE